MDELDRLALKNKQEQEQHQVSNQVANITQTFAVKEQASDTSEVIEKLQQEALLHAVKTDKATQEKLLDNAKKSAENEFYAMEQKTIAKKQEATYNANEEACRNYGIDKAVALWQIKLMKIGSAIWFILYFIIATFTIAPIMVFFKGIKSFIKQTWLAVIFALLLYLVLSVVIPLLSIYVFPKIPKK